MTLSAIIALLVAVSKAIPPLAGLCSQVILALDKYDHARNEAIAISRKSEKDASARAAVDRYRVHPPSVEQQPETPESK